MQVLSKRLDIQGLRGVAVILVVLDHAFGAPTGGFLGVDSFFVISGFVIGASLLRERDDTGRIAIGRFALRRLRRLAPTAVVAVLVTLAAGSLLLGAGRFADVLLDGVASLFGVANWRFASAGTGYFDQGAPPSPLQHFWSLGVEEQFYLVLPLLLLALPHRSAAGHRLTVSVLAIVGSASFFYALWAVHVNPNAAYFATTTRAWELLLGVLLAALVRAGWFRAKLAGLVALLGITLLLGSMMMGSSDWGVPAPLALAPTLGTAMVIWAGSSSETTLVAKALAFRPLVWVGDISYSLYVWHWPVLVLVPAVLPWPPAALVALSLALAALSHSAVEQRFRTSPVQWRDRGPSGHGRFEALGALAISTVVVASMALDRVAPLDLPTSASAFADEQEPAASAEDAADAEEESASKARQALIAAAVSARQWPNGLDPNLDTLTAKSFGAEQIEAGPWSNVLQCSDLKYDRSLQQCTFGGTEKPTVMLVGDSTAAYSAPAFASVAEGENAPWRFVDGATFGCPFTARDVANGESLDCRTARERTMERIRTVRPDVLIVTNVFGTQKDTSGNALSTTDAAAGVQDGIESVRAAVGTAVVMPPIRPGASIAECSASIKGPSACLSTSAFFGEFVKADRSAAKAHGNLYVDSAPLWCASGKCPAFIGTTPTRMDQVHVYPGAAVESAPALVELLDDAGVFEGLAGDDSEQAPPTGS